MDKCNRDGWTDEWNAIYLSREKLSRLCEVWKIIPASFKIYSLPVMVIAAGITETEMELSFLKNHPRKKIKDLKAEVGICFAKENPPHFPYEWIRPYRNIEITAKQTTYDQTDENILWIANVNFFRRWRNLAFMTGIKVTAIIDEWYLMPTCRSFAWPYGESKILRQESDYDFREHRKTSKMSIVGYMLHAGRLERTTLTTISLEGLRRQKGI